MAKNIEDILNETLAPEMKASIQEAIQNKVEAMRSEIEESVRAELSARYEHDKSQLVEAADQMISDVLREHEEAKAEELSKLSETRARYDAAIKESKNAVRGRIAEMSKASHKLIAESISTEVRKLREQKKTIAAKAGALAEDVDATKAQLVENHKKHIEKINKFVESQLAKEIAEFQQDKRALVETRVKLIRENKAKLAEAQTKFFKEASKKAETAISETLTREMQQLHADIERNRENAFGRRIFEAVAAEFMSSHLLEGTEIRKLQQIVEGHDAVVASKDAALVEVTNKLNESVRQIEATERKVALVEARSERKAIMGDLLANLRGEKRTVMESMLENTKTGALRATFDRLLPVVLAEAPEKKAAPRKVLSESKATISHGDRKPREEVQPDANGEIANIVHLAGISKK